MTVFVYNAIIGNPNLGQSPVYVFFNISRPEQVGDTTFGMNVYKEKLLNAGKSQGYNFSRLWVIEGKLTGAKLPPPPHHPD